MEDARTDEATFAEIADALAAGLAAALPVWLERRCRALIGSTGVALDVEADVALAARCAELGAELHAVAAEVVRADVDAGRGSPLDVIRRGLGPVTELLAGHGVPPVVRDEFEQRAFPDDTYGLAPASFADIDPGLHDLGVAWGAARAYLHLQRRRASP